jgi:hypothetical protein
MKKLYLILIFVCATFYAYSQENMITVSGGYAFANFENTDMNPAGWRINGTYEYNPSQGPWALGFAVGYIGLSGSEEKSNGTVDHNIGTIPIYFAPKYMFGSEKIKGYIKGALGTQTSHFKRNVNNLEFTDTDWGFYGGGSLGFKISLSEMIFLNAEYELAWLSNVSYQDGLINSALLGIGVKF